MRLSLVLTVALLLAACAVQPPPLASKSEALPATHTAPPAKTPRPQPTPRVIVAGVSDFGAGLPALQATLGDVSDVVFDAAGTTYLCDREAGRLWRLERNGILNTAAGNGGFTPATEIEGAVATDVALGPLATVSVDPRGNVLLLQEKKQFTDWVRLSRLDVATGKLHELYRSTHDIRAVFVDAEGVVRVLEANVQYPPAPRLLELVPGASPKLNRAYTETESSLAGRAERVGRDAQGRFYMMVTSFFFGKNRVIRLDPADWSFHLMDGVNTIDGTGHLMRNSTDQESQNLEVIADDGTVIETVQGPDRDFRGMSFSPDGTPWLFDSHTVWRRSGSTFVQMAGTLSPELQSVSGVAAGTAGLYVTDHAARVLHLFDAQGVRTTAYTAAATLTGAIAIDPTGVVYLAEKGESEGSIITRIGLDGKSAPYATLPDYYPYDLAAAADGSVYVAVEEKILRVPPGGGQATVLLDLLAPDITALSAAARLAIDPKGALIIASPHAGGSLRRWTLADGVSVIKAGDARLAGSSVTVDARGRIYVVKSNPSAIFRYDPDLDAIVPIAGPNAPLFAGNKPDDGLGYVTDLSIGPDGSLYLADSGAIQVKRIAAADLP